MKINLPTTLRSGYQFLNGPRPTFQNPRLYSRGFLKIKPEVSIVIANWNGGKVLSDCLYSLLKLDFKSWELILVDNGSADDSLDLTNKIIPKDKLVIIKNLINVGFAIANNQGYEASVGKYLLFLNNDTKVSPGLLTKLVNKMEVDETIGVLQPKILLMDNPGLLDNTGSFFTRIGFLHHEGFLERDGERFNDEREVFSAKGACMMVRRDVIEKVKLFDEDFISYFEESDFCWRVWLYGKRVLFFPKAYIYHKLGFTIKRQNVLEINYHYYKNRINSLIKCLSVKNMYILFFHLFISFGIAFLFIIKGNIKNCFMILKAILWNFINIGNTLKKRAFVQSQRRVADDRLFKKLMINIDWFKYYKDFLRVERDIKK